MATKSNALLQFHILVDLLHSSSMHSYPAATVLPPKGTAWAAGITSWCSGRTQPCPAHPRKCMTMSSPALQRCFGSFAFVLSSLSHSSSSPACKGALSALSRLWCTQGTHLLTGSLCRKLQGCSAWSPCAGCFFFGRV